MATANIYLNFDGQTEQALRFYADVFGTAEQLVLQRFAEMPQGDGIPPVSDDIKQRVLHGALPLLGGAMLMASDTMPGMPHNVGNNFSISLHPDSREDADRLYALLLDGGTPGMPLADAFWGAYFGTLTDRFGVQWMFNVEGAAAS